MCRDGMICLCSVGGVCVAFPWPISLDQRRRCDLANRQTGSPLADSFLQNPVTYVILVQTFLIVSALAFYVFCRLVELWDVWCHLGEVWHLSHRQPSGWPEVFGVIPCPSSQLLVSSSEVSMAEEQSQCSFPGATWPCHRVGTAAAVTG